MITRHQRIDSNNVLNKSYDPYGAGGEDNKIKNSQVRIQKLMEDRKRTMKQIDNESAYDELEQLQVQVDQGYNTDDINKYRDGIHAYTNDIKKDRDMKNDEKARRLGNIRSKISSFDPSQGPAIRINYEAAKPLMNRRIDKLNGIIRSERARETNDERRLVLENIHAKVPNYDNHNRSVLDNIDKKPPMDMRQPLISNYKMVREFM